MIAKMLVKKYALICFPFKVISLNLLIYALFGNIKLLHTHFKNDFTCFTIELRHYILNNYFPVCKKKVSGRLGRRIENAQKMDRF